MMSLAQLYGLHASDVLQFRVDREIDVRHGTTHRDQHHPLLRETEIDRPQVVMLPFDEDGPDDQHQGDGELDHDKPFAK
jgi:hypothetical protein